MEYTIREMTVMEYPLLNEFLYEAIFIPDGIKPPLKNIIASPELQIYVDRFVFLQIVEPVGRTAAACRRLPALRPAFFLPFFI